VQGREKVQTCSKKPRYRGPFYFQAEFYEGCRQKTIPLHTGDQRGKIAGREGPEKSISSDKFTSVKYKERDLKKRLKAELGVERTAHPLLVGRLGKNAARKKKTPTEEGEDAFHRVYRRMQVDKKKRARRGRSRLRRWGG